jgi:hypothetical protein
MKKTLSLLLLSVALVAGCGSSQPNYVVTSTISPPVTAARAVIPPEGGEVAIPEAAGIGGRMIFEPGAATGTEITMLSSLEPPAGANLLEVGLDSPQATTQPYFHLTFRVNQPTPLALLEGIRLEGEIPSGHEHYHADLHSVGAVRPQGSNGGSASFLQEFPGEHDGAGAIHDELQDDGTILQPGVDYVARFKSTDQQLLEFTFVNNSGIEPCYLTIKGENPNPKANDKRFYYVNGEGELVPMDLDDLVDGYADYNILVPKDGKVKLPLALSGRMYISLGEKLKTQLFPPNGPNDPPALWGSPNGWSNAADPNYQTLWDFVEFDYKISGDTKLPGMGVNTTQVQMTAIPTTLSLTNRDGTVTETSGARGPGTRQAFIEAIAADPDFKSLIVPGQATNTRVSPLRVVSADNGIRNLRANIPNVPTFDAHFYAHYIDQVWEKYRSEDLILKTSAFGTFVGRVNDQDQLIFTQPGKRTVVVPKPDSADVIVGDGKLLADMPNAQTEEERQVVGEVASCLSACFNRTTLLVSNQVVRNPGDFDPKNFALFYQNVPTNVYSKLNHELSLPTVQAPLGGAYGFGYDDNLNQSSVIIDNNNPQAMVITIPPFEAE